MYCCKNTHNALFFSSIGEISTQIWEQLGCTQNLYFHPNYLQAIEQHHEQIYFSYIVLLDSQQHPIAFATIQIVDFYLDSVQNGLQSTIEKIKCIGRKLRLISEEKPLKILTCGNTFVSGEHGIYIKSDQNKKSIIKDLAKAILHFVNANTQLKKDISAFMLKDFIKESLFITDELHDYNYYSFNVEPNMLLKIDLEWESFDDYLAAMKTKFRVKAKKAMKQSSSLRVEQITTTNIDTILAEMTALYKKVSDKAEFNLGDFNLHTYKDLKAQLGEQYVLKSYWLEDKFVGFLSGVINQNTLDAHFVGIDYQLNKTYAIYQRMLYDYIRVAIDRKLEYINFGRTASEIKSSVGAEPQDLTIYLRHKNSIPNRILSLFLKRIEPTPFQQKFPFKTKSIVEKT